MKEHFIKAQLRVNQCIISFTIFFLFNYFKSNKSTFLYIYLFLLLKHGNLINVTDFDNI